MNLAGIFIALGLAGLILSCCTGCADQSRPDARAAVTAAKAAS